MGEGRADLLLEVDVGEHVDAVPVGRDGVGLRLRHELFGEQRALFGDAPVAAEDLLARVEDDLPAAAVDDDHVVAARELEHVGAADDGRDPEFARAFFAIWLGPQTSAPKLRAALLNGRTA